MPSMGNPNPWHTTCQGESGPAGRVPPASAPRSFFLLGLQSQEARAALEEHHAPAAAFSIRNTIRRSARWVISTLSPVSRIRFGMSITDSGSVQCTSNKAPGVSAFSALRVFNAGNGHLRPVRSSFVVLMRPYMANATHVVNGHRRTGALQIRLAYDKNPTVWPG